mmetsp:Transcript_10517/g.33443  ORF Transcript_10517/g.33443 Transcript_10517/m.33443 type:complete len:250 (+) Transcript_10517:2910-3659(+)
MLAPFTMASWFLRSSSSRDAICLATAVPASGCADTSNGILSATRSSADFSRVRTNRDRSRQPSGSVPNQRSSPASTSHSASTTPPSDAPVSPPVAPVHAPASASAASSLAARASSAASTSASGSRSVHVSRSRSVVAGRRAARSSSDVDATSSVRSARLACSTVGRPEMLAGGRSRSGASITDCSVPTTISSRSFRGDTGCWSVGCPYSLGPLRCRVSLKRGITSRSAGLCTSMEMTEDHSEPGECASA